MGMRHGAFAATLSVVLCLDKTDPITILAAIISLFIFGEAGGFPVF